MADLPLIPGTLALDCYPPSAQAFYNEMFSRGHAVGPTSENVLVQDAAPDPADRGVKVWVPTSGGIPIYPGYVFVWHPTVGHWVARHPDAPGAATPAPYLGALRIYTGDSASLATYDGGDANPATIASGPMWEINTAFAGSVPVGVGLIPGSSPAATILAPLATKDDLNVSGEYNHVITEAEGAVGLHTHAYGLYGAGDIDAGNYVGAPVGVTAYTAGNVAGTGAGSTVAETTASLFTLAANNGAGVTGTPLNNMQPYVGVYFIKRTIRAFYTAG